MINQSKLKTKETDELFEAILMLKDTKECYQFFTDICTAKELQSLSQRLQVAKLLKIRHTYATIEEKTGVSTATIARVNKSLNYGADGYDLVLKQLIKKDLNTSKE